MTVTCNGKKHRLKKADAIGYGCVLALAGVAPDTTLPRTVTYFSTLKGIRRIEGVMLPGYEIPLYDGMIFSVVISPSTTKRRKSTYRKLTRAVPPRGCLQRC